MKLKKYYVIVYLLFFTEQGKTVKTEIKSKENHETKMTEKPKTKICNDLGNSYKSNPFKNDLAYFYLIHYCALKLNFTSFIKS